MPARQSKPKSTAKKATTKQAVTKTARQGKGHGRLASGKEKASWQCVAQPTKKFVLNTFDTGVTLLMHKVPENISSDVHTAFLDARNQVAVCLEMLRVPPSKQEYTHLSGSLRRLKDLKQQLEQRQSSLNRTLDNQERELQKLEDEKVRLQDFGKLPGKHHPILLEPLENELHLNINKVK